MSANATAWSLKKSISPPEARHKESAETCRRARLCSTRSDVARRTPNDRLFVRVSGDARGAHDEVAVDSGEVRALGVPRDLALGRVLLRDAQQALRPELGGDRLHPLEQPLQPRPRG